MRHQLGTIVALFLAGLTIAAGQDGKGEKKTTVDVGDRAPNFEAPDEEGRTWQSSKHIGKKIIVLYFYPGDFTPGCTAQAQKFRDHMNKISDLGAEVVGISGDAPTTHALFKQAYKLNFSLLSDEDGRVAKQFGVPVGPGGTVKAKDADNKPLTLKREVTTVRWTFIIGLDGKIAYKNTKVEPVADSKQVEAFLQKLDKK
jgi:peroxiredoxin Q/BCP